MLYMDDVFLNITGKNFVQAENEGWNGGRKGSQNGIYEGCNRSLWGVELQSCKFFGYKTIWI